MKKMTKAELEKLRSKGAVVRTIKEAEKKPDPKPDTSMQDALEAITKSLSEGQMQLAEKLITVVRSNTEGGAKPVPFRFIIKRDRRGLMEEIEAYPITENQN